MKILIYGAGVIGSIFAAKLFRFHRQRDNGDEIFTLLDISNSGFFLDGVLRDIFYQI